MPNPQTGKPSKRGPICRVCVHKFMVREKVLEVVSQINATKVSMVQGLKNLASQGIEAKSQLHQEQDTNEYTLTQIKETE